MDRKVPVAGAETTPVLEQQVGFTLVLATRAVLAAYRPLLEPLGMTHPQYLVMVCLWQRGPLTVKELGQILQLDSGTLSPLLKRLELMGLVRRRRATADERTVTVTVTDSGLALQTAASEVAAAALHRIGMSPADLRRLQDVLEPLVRAGNAPDGGRPLPGGTPGHAAGPRPA